jgi:hypothetical protein
MIRGRPSKIVSVLYPTNELKKKVLNHGLIKIKKF